VFSGAESGELSPKNEELSPERKEWIMALFAISDLHLALSVDKPMDVFGPRWAGYMDKLKENWCSVVGEDDYVVVPGDISWATYLDQAYEDFRFIHELPGKKIISKGNHDYWWTTRSKLEKFVGGNGFTSISFMHNNSFSVEGATICGTRGWEMPGEVGFGAEDAKIYQRELQRLEMSLQAGLAEISSDPALAGNVVIAALHYPPFNSRGEFSGFMDIMKKYGVKLCIYGHLHGDACRGAVEGLIDDIMFRLVAADHLGFMPEKLY
jgi:predicted phosphohydrolase